VNVRVDILVRATDISHTSVLRLAEDFMKVLMPSHLHQLDGVLDRESYRGPHRYFSHVTNASREESEDLLGSAKMNRLFVPVNERTSLKSR